MFFVGEFKCSNEVLSVPNEDVEIEEKEEEIVKEVPLELVFDIEGKIPVPFDVLEKPLREDLLSLKEPIVVFEDFESLIKEGNKVDEEPEPNMFVEEET